MWFKRVLLGYCAASLAVTIVTASCSKNANVPKRHHQVERLTFPSLERRQQPVRNHTSSIEIIVPTPNDATSSSVFKFPEASQTSTIVNTPTTTLIPESISSFPPFPMPSASGPGFSFITSSSKNVDVSITSLRSIESTMPFKSAIEQQPSQTTTPALSSPSQDANSKHATSSTVFDITSAVSSFTEKLWLASSVETGPSASSSILESTPVPITTSEVLLSSTPTPSPSLSSSPGSVEGTSRTQSDAISTFPGDSVTSVVLIKTETSTLPTPLSQTIAPETSSVVLNTPTLPSESFPTTTTSIEQQPTSLLVSSTKASDIQVLSSATSVAPSIGRTSTFSSVPASLIADSQSSSSGVAETSLSAALEPTTVAATSSAERTTSVQQHTASSIMVSSAFELSSVLVSTTSTIEETQPTPPASFLVTSAAPINSVQQPSSGSLAQSTPITSNIASSIVDEAPEASVSSQPIVSASSSQIEPISTVSEVLSLSSPPVGLGTSVISLDPTIGAQPSISAAPTPLSSVTMIQITSSLIEIRLTTSSLLDTVSTQSVSLASISSSLVLMLSPTFVRPGTSVATTLESATTGLSSAMSLPSASIGPSAQSSATSERELSPSFSPSETLVTSAMSSMVPSSESFVDASQVSSLASTLLGTRLDSSVLSSTMASVVQPLPSSVVIASGSQATSSQTPSLLSFGSISSSLLSASSSSSLPLSLIVSMSLALPSQHPTSTAAPSMNSTIGGAIPTSETAGFSVPTSFLGHESVATPTPNGISILASSSIRISTFDVPWPSSVLSNSTQTTSLVPIIPGTITATFSIVYVSSARSSSIDLSTVAFSLLSTVVGAVVNQTAIRTSAEITATTTSRVSGTRVPASESLTAPTELGSGANSTWSSPLQSSLTATIGLPSSLNSTKTSAGELGITFSRSALLTGATTAAIPSFNATQAETLPTSSVPVAVDSTTAGLFASPTSDSVSSGQPNTESATSASNSDEASTISGADTEDTKISAEPHAPTSTPSQTAAAGSPPPLTISQTAGVAVGATTGLLIAVVAAIFIARRYHAAKHGKRMSTGSIYPKVAYLYDPKTGGDGGDAEALMPGATSGPVGPVSTAGQGFPRQMQRHSIGTMPAACFTSPGNPSVETAHDPAVNRYSEYARIDTARALSAAVAGCGGAASHSSSYTKCPSDVTNPFSDRIIPSPTFAPFSPDDIRRPELRTSRSVNDGRGEYSQMSVNHYAYLNTVATMYPPVSPYRRPSIQSPSPTYDTRRQTIDSDPFADPFEHDLILQVDEQNRTSDSVTVFAPSPNLISPRTSRTPIGPKLPVRHSNGMTSARSLLSPVAAKYLHEAQEVKIPRKSVSSPILVQVGRSPVIKPFSPPPAAPEPLGWDDIKRNSGKHFSDKQSVPAPLKFASPVIKKKPVPTSHTCTKPSLTGAGQALLAGNGLPLTVKIPHRYSKSVGLHVPRVHGRPDPAHEELSSDPIVREKRSRELRFADPALIGKEF